VASFDRTFEVQIAFYEIPFEDAGTKVKVCFTTELFGSSCAEFYSGDASFERLS
jgi:hypothetical protein